MNKELSKAIMNRRSLTNIYLRKDQLKTEKSIPNSGNTVFRY